MTPRHIWVVLTEQAPLHFQNLDKGIDKVLHLNEVFDLPATSVKHFYKEKLYIKYFKPTNLVCKL